MTIMGFYLGMTVFWLVIAVIFGILEAITTGLVTIWFAGGALVALVASLLGAGTLVQVILFVIVSVILLVFTRRVFVGKLKTGSEKTNVDALIGREAMVTKEIKPFETGIIKIGGQEWTAICKEDAMAIAAGEKVYVNAIEGVKAVVSLVKE